MLDTSVIVDGRIADVVDAGFMGGRLLVPRMVVPRAADAGRLAATPSAATAGAEASTCWSGCAEARQCSVVMDEGDLQRGGEVDAALVGLARAAGGTLLTNDAALGSGGRAGRRGGR